MPIKDDTPTPKARQSGNPMCFTVIHRMGRKEIQSCLEFEQSVFPKLEFRLGVRDHD